MKDDDAPLDLRLQFAVPVDGDDDPRPIVHHLVETVPRFMHLKAGEAVIMTVMRRFDKVKQGRTILGTMALPVAQGGMREMFSWLLAVTCGEVFPDFILTLDATFWSVATRMQREALVFHELCHCHHETDKEGELRFDDTGRPVFGIVGHDIEEFNDVVRRYGAWLGDVERFAQALREGGVS